MSYRQIWVCATCSRERVWGVSNSLHLDPRAQRYPRLYCVPCGTERKHVFLRMEGTRAALAVGNRQGTRSAYFHRYLSMRARERATLTIQTFWKSCPDARHYYGVVRDAHGRKLFEVGRCDTKREVRQLASVRARGRNLRMVYNLKMEHL